MKKLLQMFLLDSHVFTVKMGLQMFLWDSYVLICENVTLDVLMGFPYFDK